MENREILWSPQPEGLNQIITLLKQSQSTDNQIQRNVQLVSQSFRNTITLLSF
jgi:cation transport ATPase